MAEGTDSDRTEFIGAPSPEPAASRLHQNALPVGTLLGEFEIIDLVGEGGFGIVYLAQDHSLHRKVALKEYMPALLASRGEDCSVSVRSERQRETFDIGLRSFVNEARMLAQFDHAALVKVYRFWEAHGTAYMVMPFFSGQTLQDALKERAEPPDEAWIKALLLPLMEALAILHADQVYHRDIAPDNIMLLGDGRPVLLDFGAARRVISDMTHALTVILKPGYAPIEQYADMPGMKQGPWTDVYALAAVVYFMIRKRKPPPSVGRLMEDDYEPLAGSEVAGRYSEQLLRGIDKCLSVRAQDRPQSMAAMREAIGFGDAPTVAIAAPTDSPAGKTEPSFSAPEAPTEAPAPEAVDIQLPESVEESAEPAPRSKVPLVVAAVLALSLLAGGYAYFAGRQAPATRSAMPPVAVAPATRTPSAPAAAVPAPPPAPRIASLGAAVDAALAAADPGLSVTLEAPASVAIGTELKLVARSKSDGLLYVFAWDPAGDKVYRLAPDEKDGGVAIKADAAFAVAHKDPAAAAAKPGNWRVVAMLAEKPRDFSGSAFVREGDALVAERAALEARLAANGLSGLFGAVQCAPGETCQDRFAIAVANVAREAAPPPAARRAPAPGPATPGKKNTDSEREYMKRFNKDLDNLLGK
ncbi:MAG: protein kinase [Burkholderiales bacterium]|nr:protein kinase [Burkholderiales bacterium]